MRQQAKVGPLPDTPPTENSRDGSAADYTQELIEETADIPENLRFYIDYEAIARDMKVNGEIEELDHETLVTNGYDF